MPDESDLNDTDASDGTERLYTNQEVEEIVSKRLARERRSGQRPPPPPARAAGVDRPASAGAAGNDVSGMISELVKLHTLQALSALKPQEQKRVGPPVSDGGSPQRDPSLATEGAIWRMTQGEVDSLIREKGYAGAGKFLRDRMKLDMKNTRIHLGRLHK